MADKVAKNPLISKATLPPFAEIKVSHIKPAMEETLANLESSFSKLEKEHEATWEGLLEPLMDIGQELEKVWGVVSHLNGVQNSDELRMVHAELQPKVIEFGLKLSQNEKIYQSLLKIKESGAWKKFDSAQKRIVEKSIRYAKHSGIALEGKNKERFNLLLKDLSSLSTQFSNNVLDATKAYSLALRDKSEIAGLPHSYLVSASHAYTRVKKEASTPENGPWLVTLDAPSFIPFMENASQSELRAKVYKAYISRAASGDFDNRELIRSILQKRGEQAKLLGYKTYSELSLSEKMADSEKRVYDLLEELRSASWEPAKAELAEMQALANKMGHKGDLKSWDMAYYGKRLQEQKYQYSDEELKPYFPLQQVLDGLFQIAKSLFGVTIKAADGEAQVWHKDVRFFKVYDGGNQIAAFFLDPYSRPENKKGGAWMDVCVTRKRVGKDIQLPVAYLICNSTVPLGEEPSLMTFSEVETLFHEFGHGLQHMLTVIDYPEASGISGVEWDAVELPSQFMENWCYHEKTLKSIAKHYKTKEVIPDELFKKLLAARTFRAGQFMLRQLQFAFLDLNLHFSYDPHGEKTVFEEQKEVALRTSVLPPLSEDYFLCSFSHIFSGGYAAGYYSYKWAEVLSADAFEAFLEAGVDDEEKISAVGRRFRNTVLALGGSQSPMEVFKAFRGREPQTFALLKQNSLV